MNVVHGRFFFWLPLLSDRDPVRLGQIIQNVMLSGRFLLCWNDLYGSISWNDMAAIASNEAYLSTILWSNLPAIIATVASVMFYGSWTAFSADFNSSGRSLLPFTTKNLPSHQLQKFSILNRQLWQDNQLYRSNQSHIQVERERRIPLYHLLILPSNIIAIAIKLNHPS